MKTESNEAFEGDDGQVLAMEVRKQSVDDSNGIHSIEKDTSKFDVEAITAEEDEDPPHPLVLKLREHKTAIQNCMWTLLHIVVGAYFAYATYFLIHSENTEQKVGEDQRCYGNCGFQWCDGYGMLLLIIVFVYFGLFYYYIFKPTLGKRLHRAFLKIKCNSGTKRFATIALCAICVVAIAVFLYFECRDEPQKVTGITAPCFFILAGFVFSTNRRAIKWRTVIVGIVCQFLLGVFCIRWEVGRNIFKCLGDKVATFLTFSEEGSRFVFGDDIVTAKIFAFAILPVIFFFSFFISILYYLGTMQWIVMKLGWILQSILGTTVCESVNSAANIFLGMSESPLLIRPYIKSLTASEIHSIMASGFATVSGTVLAAYMSFGASPAHLITSSVMAAPAALAISKLYLPETEESKTTSENMKLEKSQDSSILDAASNGANAAIPIILGIIANIVAFVAFIAFLNSVVNWFGYLVGLNDIDFEWIFSKLFIPLAWGMGVPWEDCDIVAKVIATKTIINEFVAYERLGAYKAAGAISARSAGITTFAICGFANPSSLGILMGSLGAMAPERRGEITSVAVRAFIVGSIVCFVSASFAGILIQDEVESRDYADFLSKSTRYNQTFI